MVKPVRCLPRKPTFLEIRNILNEMAQLRIFPIVDKEGLKILLTILRYMFKIWVSENQILVGTITRSALLALLDSHVGDEARKVFVLV